MTPAEGATWLGVPNVIMVRYHGKPTPPYQECMEPLRPFPSVVWSIVGAGGETSDEERKHVLDILRGYPNIRGVIMDDFFKSDGKGSLSLTQLADVRRGIEQVGRPLELWVVLYAHQLDVPVGPHLQMCDTVTFWTWKQEQLDQLEENFATVERLAPRCGKVLGCYMWDFGNSKPMSVERMRRQCELGVRWLREGRIKGMIFLASCICDLGLETVEWTRRWIAECDTARGAQTRSAGK
jgi:hypothetical protein